jgi:ABC-type phosphonate transport system ATPase subunit
MDWAASWRRTAVTDAEWRALREAVRREADAWAAVLRAPRDGPPSEVEAGWLIGSVAHVAYHLGAIRQLARDARGPTAEDEARAEAALRQAGSGQ